MNDLYVSMNAGEWSPLLTCRHDLDKRKAACKKLENMIVLEHGGIARRPGVIIQDSVADTAHRLIPFESSLVNAFVLDIRSGATAGCLQFPGGEGCFCCLSVDGFRAFGDSVRPD